MIKVLGGIGGCFCKLNIERNFDESIAKYACVFLVRNEAIGHDPSRGGPSLSKHQAAKVGLIGYFS